MSQALDIRSFPLHGSQLIEASAGTGKTFTIALLYIRLILQHGIAEPAPTPGVSSGFSPQNLLADHGDGQTRAGSAFSRPLLPEEILVVTFTEAATQELRERIRARLAEAARCFLEPDAQHDPLLEQLRNDYSRSQWLHGGRLLSLAAQSMDQAAISTIHGWCYRMLREHAFDSGSLFHQTLVADQRETHKELVRDYWRHEYYSLSSELAELVYNTFPTPAELLRAVYPLLHQLDTMLTLEGRRVHAPERLAAALQPFADRSRRLYELQQRARTAWRDNQVELEALLDQLRPQLNKNRYREAKADETFQELKQSLRDWAAGGPSPNRMERFAAGGWGLTGKPAPAQPSHPALAALADFIDQQEQQAGQDDATGIMILHCAQWLEQALIERQQRHAELGFDDLLRRLDSALTGPQGTALADQIRQQFPVAMIDEFQDTDPLQYRIFNHIYQIEKNRTDCGLILIGDPKQAIYSFRNADIHTYLAARRATTGRHHHLQRNYRSTGALVDAVNSLFVRAEQSPRGAFRFRNEHDDPLPFLPVSAQGRDDRLQVEGSAQAPMTLWHLRPAPDQQVIRLAHYRQDMAIVCARTVAGLLRGANANSQDDTGNGFQNGDTWRPLRPKDIAILIRNRTEAELVRAELARVNLASVYLSDRESVFASREAEDILLCLQACADPMHERKVRAALASQSLERSLDELRKLYQDEDQWEATCELFRALHGCWQTRGVLPMLRQLLHSLDLPQRLLGKPGGDRRLTNLLHLAEYLQRASVDHDGELALIRHLSEQIDNPGDEEILRLENDADLIRVVTIHKSKGLEYPLVFVPFAAAWKQIDGTQKHVRFMDPEHGRRLEFGRSKADADAWQQADDERLSEDLRLFYVAATRATHALWLSVAALAPGNAGQSKLDRSALGYLLGGGAPVDESALTQHLTAFSAECAEVTVLSLTDPTHEMLVDSALPATDQPSLFRPARQATRKVDPNWWIASYSALKTAAAGSEDALQPAAAREEQAIEEAATMMPLDELTPITAARQKFSRTQTGLHGFHRGPGPGTFLHGLLEWAAHQGFSTATTDLAAQRDMIQQRCQTRGWETDADRLDQWLTGFLQLPFTAPGTSPLTLTDLTRYRVEMEFMFPSHKVDTHRLDALCHEYLMPGHPRPALQAMRLNGMVKGFVDLVAEHQGRFYVIDWKSNYLGPSDEHYSADALTAEMLHHRYDVQSALYLLALHRSLRSRMSDYDYERHTGGAWYLFLRGWQASSQGLTVTRPPPAFIDALDRLFDHD